MPSATYFSPVTSLVTDSLPFPQPCFLCRLQGERERKFDPRKEEMISFYLKIKTKHSIYLDKQQCWLRHQNMIQVFLRQFSMSENHRICVCACARVYVCSCLCMCLRVHVYVCAHLCACIYMCICTRAHMCMCVHMCTCTHVCVHVFMCVHAHMCVCTCVYARVCV